MKKNFLISFIIIGITLTACSGKESYEGDVVENNSNEANLDTIKNEPIILDGIYKNEDFNIHLNYPENWQLIDVSDPEVLFFLLSDTEDSVSLNFFSQEITAGRLDITDERTLEIFKDSNYTNIQTTDIEEIEINNIPFNTVTKTFNDEDESYIQTEYYYEDKEKNLLHYIAVKSKTGINKDVANEILNSYTIG